MKKSEALEQFRHEIRRRGKAYTTEKTYVYWLSQYADWLTVHPHVMRHSFATESLRNGLDIKSLATLMGHKSTATTEIYLHCLPELAFRAVSPLDAQPNQVVPFDPPANQAVFRAV